MTKQIPTVVASAVDVAGKKQWVGKQVCDVATDTNWLIYLRSTDFDNPIQVPWKFVMIDNLANNGIVTVTFGPFTLSVPQFSRKSFRMQDQCQSISVNMTVGTVTLFFLETEDLITNDANLYNITTAAGTNVVYNWTNEVAANVNQTLATHSNKNIAFSNAGAQNFNLLAVGNVPNGYINPFLWNLGPGNLSIIPNGTDVIRIGTSQATNASPLVLSPGQMGMLSCDATQWYFTTSEQIFAKASITAAGASALALRSGSVVAGNYCDLSLGLTGNVWRIGVCTQAADFSQNANWNGLIASGQGYMVPPTTWIMPIAGRVIFVVPATNTNSLYWQFGTWGGGSAINVNDGGSVQFPSANTTGNSANAFLDNTASNNLLRSTSSAVYKADVQPYDASGVSIKSLPVSLIPITPIGVALPDTPMPGVSVVDSLRPIHYQSLASADDKTRRFVGLIAEDVAAVAPEFITYTKMGALQIKSQDGQRILFTDPRFDPSIDPETPVAESVAYDRLGVAAIAELKNLRSVVAQQGQIINALRAKLGI
jgi:hypothetical protein